MEASFEQSAGTGHNLHGRPLAKWVRSIGIIATLSMLYDVCQLFLGQKTLYVPNKKLGPCVTMDGHHGNRGNIQAADESCSQQRLLASAEK